MRRHEEILKAYYEVKKSNLKRPQTIWLQLCDIPEKQNYGDNKQISSCKWGEMSR